MILLKDIMVLKKRYKHINCTDVSFIPVNIIWDERDFIEVKGYWHNDFYKKLCTDKVDEFKIYLKDLPKWKLISHNP